MPKSTLVKTLLESFCWSILFLAVGILCFCLLFKFILNDALEQGTTDPIAKVARLLMVSTKLKGCSKFVESQQFFFHSISFSDLHVPVDLVFGTPTKRLVTERTVTKHSVTGRSVTEVQLPGRQVTRRPVIGCPDYLTSSLPNVQITNVQITILFHKSHSVADPDLQRSFCWSRIGILNF
jgi:hypothetical protein